jgi:uncharacterized protein YndB with AHSA1/START domain
MIDGTLTRNREGTYLVAFERIVKRPIAKVWATISEPALLKNWLGDVELDLRVGGKFIIRFRDVTVVMTGVITTLEPERVLEYTWLENYGMPQSIVRWELAPDAKGTRLRLTHKVPADAVKKDVIEFLPGWHQFLDILPDAIDGKFVPYGYEDEKKIAVEYRAKYLGGPFMEDKGESSRVLSVTFDRMLPGPIERVWEHLTVPANLKGWFGDDSTIEPRLGGAVRLMGGHIRGTITQWRPPLVLAYTWNVFGPGDGEDAVSAFPESYLSLMLEPRGKDVMLRLKHLPVLDRFENQNKMGWHTFLDILTATLRGEEVKPRPEYMKKNAALYGVDLANLQR